MWKARLYRNLYGPSDTAFRFWFFLLVFLPLAVWGIYHGLTDLPLYIGWIGVVLILASAAFLLPRSLSGFRMFLLAASQVAFWVPVVGFLAFIVWISAR